MQILMLGSLLQDVLDDYCEGIETFDAIICGREIASFWFLWSLVFTCIGLLTRILSYERGSVVVCVDCFVSIS